MNLDPSVDRSIVFRTVWAQPSIETSVFLGTNYFGVDWLSEAQVNVDASTLADSVYRIFEDQSLSGANQLFIRGIWGTASKVAFVGDEGHLYEFDIGNSNFQPIVSPTNAALWGIWGSGLGDVWIVGEREMILHGALP